jgi:hypothetical protein
VQLQENEALVKMTCVELAEVAGLQGGRRTNLGVGAFAKTLPLTNLCLSSVRIRFIVGVTGLIGRRHRR